jgi:phosphotransferase system  glucose/maltose/N-acetylglucosamine-specific IIC component
MWQFLWEVSYLRYLCLFTVNVLCFCFVFLRLVYPMLAVSLGSLLFTLFVFVYYTHIVFLFCLSSSCVPYVCSFSGRALINVICVCLLYTYCVFVLFFFVLCTLCWQSPPRETANIGYTRRRKTKQKHNTCIVNKHK